MRNIGIAIVKQLIQTLVRLGVRGFITPDKMLITCLNGRNG